MATLAIQHRARTDEGRAKFSNNAHKGDTMRVLRKTNICLIEQRTALNVTYESTRINGK